MKLLKNKKMVSVVVAGLLIVGGTGTAYAVQNHSAEKEVKQEKSDKTGLELQFKKSINSLYLDKNQQLMRATIDQKVIDHAKQLLKDSKNKAVNPKLVSNLETAVTMAELQQNVNSLFESESVAKYSTDVEKTVPGIEKRLAKLDKKEFNVTQTEKVTIFKASYKEADDTNKAVLALFDGEAVKEEVTREAYDQAKQQVDSLKQIELKKQLTDKLVLVDNKLKEKEQVVAAEVQKEAEVQEQAKQQEQAQQAVTSNQQSQATTNGGNSSTAGYTDNGSRGSTPSTGGSQQGNNGNNSNNSGTTNQQPSTPPANNNGGGSWSGTGNVTGGGNVTNHGDNGGSNGATGGGNTWTGGDFDGSGIDTSGWN